MTSSPALFGTYPLASWREALRQIAGATPKGRLGIWSVSLLRRAILLGNDSGMHRQHDISAAPMLGTRLHPSSYRCEKRALAGPNVWDLVEPVPRSVWPSMTVVGMNSRPENPILDYLQPRGYRLRKQTKTNAVLEFNRSKSEVMGSA